MKRDKRVLKESFKGMKMSLGSGDPMEEVNKFMRDRIFTEERNFLNGVEDNGGFEDGGVE